MTAIANVQSRIAGLAGDEQVISGVAIGVDDVTRGLSGDRKVWQADALRAAASSLEGTPVKALHSQAEVGEVTRAGFAPDRGVVYEARLDDEKLADRVANGALEVSIEARHADGGTVDTPRGEAMAATNVQFEGLALVQHGAAPSASATPGEQAALSATDISATLDRACLAEVNDEEVDLTPPEPVVNAAEAALEAKAEYDSLSDCGTGVGGTRAQQIVDGDLAPEDFTTGGASETAIPDYLNSHAGDVEGIDTTPTQWSEETWTDGCGPVQYALWGGTATGTGLEWAQSTADAVEAAMADEEADAAEMTPTYQEGDTVAWDWSDGTANGRVGDVITGEGTVERTIGDTDVARDSDDEPVYVLDVWRGGDFEGQALKSESELDEWSDPPEDAMMAKHSGEEADMADIPDEYVYDNPGEAVSKAQDMGLDGSGDEIIHTHGDGDETVFMPAPSHEELMEMLREMGELAAADPDDPDEGEVSVDGETGRTDEQPQRYNAHMSETEEELRARLSEKDDRIAELEQENSELKDEREQVARAYAAALADGDTMLDEDDFVDRFEVSELAEMVEERESATLADVEPDVQSGGSEASEEATLSESEQAEVAEHREIIADLAGKGGVAKHERRHRAELVGNITGEDPETILEQEA